MFTSRYLSLWNRPRPASQLPKLWRVTNTWRYYLRDSHLTIHPPPVDEQQTISASYHNRISCVAWCVTRKALCVQFPVNSEGKFKSGVCLSQHFDHLKSYVVAGLDISCVGNFRTYSCIPAQNGREVSDHTTFCTLITLNPKLIRHTWRSREGDEHQRCAPRID